MIQIISKSLRIFLFGIMPFVLLAGGSKDYMDRPMLENGTYHFEVTGKTNQTLSGSATVKTSVQKDTLNGSVSMLELTFESHSNSNTQIIAFTTGQKLKNGIIPVGKYKVQNVERLFHSVEGVYGFADLGLQNELPFFVGKGNISILESDSQELVGSIATEFKNADGETLKVKGFFNATYTIRSK